MSIVPNPYGLRTHLKRKPFPRSTGFQGICIHTTGRGVREHAPLTPDQAALKWYGNTEATCPHFLIGEAGSIYHITSTELVAPHCGVTAARRNAMLDGTWTEQVGAVGLDLWRKRWPGRKSPQHLFSGPSANAAYIGIELIPGADATFGDLQYAALRGLIGHIDESERIWIQNTALPNSRLLGHEDLSPWTTAQGGRWDKLGGWDPGSLRHSPRFDWSRVSGEKLVTP